MLYHIGVYPIVMYRLYIRTPSVFWVGMAVCWGWGVGVGVGFKKSTWQEVHQAHGVPRPTNFLNVRWSVIHDLKVVS